MQPYENKPDVFELVADKALLEKLNVNRIKYAWGESKEEYCYFGDILIGMVLGSAAESKMYYEGLNIPYDNRIVIKLTPNISKNEYILCPNVDEFYSALKSLLMELSGFTLICEADCDQNAVEENIAIEEILVTLAGYCNGEHYECPTFVQRNEM